MVLMLRHTAAVQLLCRLDNGANVTPTPTNHSRLRLHTHSTQQEITDAGVNQLQLRINIIYKPK